MIMRGVVGRGLVQQAQHHRVQRHRFTGAGRTGDQQMRHLCKIGDLGLAADVLAQRQRQRRFQFVVNLRFDDFTQRHQFAGLVRDLKAHVRLAGNDLDHPHTDRRQRTRQVLGEIADLADLHARCRLDLEARNHGARMHGDHFGFDAEIAELDLDQARHRGQRLLGISALTWRRIVEQRQRRQLTGNRRLEQRHLFLLVRTLAGFELAQYRFDLRQGDAWLGPRLRHNGLTLLPGTTPFHPKLHATDQYVQLPHARQHQSPGAIHDGQPRHTGCRRDRGKPEHQQQYRRAQQSEHVSQTITDDLTDDASGGLSHPRSTEVQRRQTAAGGNGQDHTGGTQHHDRRRQRNVAITLAEQHQSTEQHQHGEQEGRLTE
jgi:hypothetical protein